MKGRTEPEEKQSKKPYFKPKLQKVILRPEEAVLGGCKKATVSVGPAQATCNLSFTCYTSIT